MSDKTATVYWSGGALTVDAIKVPGGMLYITSHHEWKVMNTVYVADTYEAKLDVDHERTNANYIDPVKVKEFIEGKR